MRYFLIWILVLFCICWFAFATIDFRGDKNTLRVYEITKVKDRISSFSGDLLPEFRTEAVSEYKVSGDKIIKKLGPFVNEYDQCKVFDVENWSCKFSDESATFGAVEGVYFTRSNTTKFPHLSGFADSTTVSRWKWISVQCEWYLGDGPIGGILGCALVPFFE